MVVNGISDSYRGQVQILNTLIRISSASIPCSIDSLSVRTRRPRQDEEEAERLTYSSDFIDAACHSLQQIGVALPSRDDSRTPEDHGKEPRRKYSQSQRRMENGERNTENGVNDSEIRENNGNNATTATTTPSLFTHTHTHTHGGGARVKDIFRERSDPKKKYEKSIVKKRRGSEKS